MRVISERHQAMLEFERSFWTLDDPKPGAIRARFQCSVDEYYSELNELLEQPEAMAHDPLVGWGWNPGVGRTPVPGTQEEFGKLIQAWADSGAQCPK